MWGSGSGEEMGRLFISYSVHVEDMFPVATINVIVIQSIACVRLSIPPSKVWQVHDRQRQEADLQTNNRHPRIE